MSALTFTIQIVGITYDIKEGSFNFGPKVEQRTKLSFTVIDNNNAFNFQKGQQVTLVDSSSTIKFTGTVHTSKRYRYGTTSSCYHHDIDCNDMHQYPDERTTNRIYTNQYAGVIFAGMVNDQLAGEGITANYAIRDDNTQSTFSQGTLSGTIATPNLGGDLELNLAGSQVTVVENSNSLFGAGSLTNMTASGNALGPSATSALKIQATQSVAGIANSYTYVKIFSAGGGISVISGRYLSYDLWISSSSPEAKIAVDIVFTDGSALRDNAVYYDIQNKSPHPNTDLKGLAVDKWYHRKFLLDNLTSKSINYVTLGIEGDTSGTYTGYIKNIYEVDVNDNVINTFFSGSLNINPPQQMQKQGYSTTSVTVVNTYDCSTSNRVSPSYNLANAAILRSSFLSYKTTLPTGYTFTMKYSIDGGNSYTPIAANNAALPNFLAGLSLSSMSIQFLQSFSQGAGALPDQQPLLNSVQLVIEPSYVASKSDVNAEFTTNGQWNAVGASFSNTQAPSNVLAPFGAIRNWDNGDYSSQTLFGGGATGPNTNTSCTQYVDSKQFRLFVYQSKEGRSRLDFAGQWQDFQMEFDVYIDNTLMRVGCVYRTTGWSNYDENFAYSLQFFGTTVNLKRGSNSSAASTGTSTVIGTATVTLTAQAIHRIKLIISGSSHLIYIDDVLALNITDGTYTGSGYVGFRVSNTDTVNGYISLFDNFGISPTSLGGSWTSQSISLTGAGTYLNSTVQWSDVSTDPTQVTNTVQSSTNGGSTWQALTNGGSISSLTPGQSLSGVNVQFKINFSANSSTVLPMMQSLTAYVLGGFSSSGTRISPVTSLASALIAGTTVVNWSAITPPNTSVVVATSPNGSSSWTNAINGGSIAGIVTQPSPVLDTFATDDHLNYTNTIRTGGIAGTWVWDTTNSRLTVSGGTNALLLWSPVWYNNSYLNKKQIIINHALVMGGADLTNFAIPIAMIDPNLINISSGGLVQNLSGFDIIFVDSTETTKLNHEIKKYVSSTGEIEMWVSIPNLSHTSDTVIYMYFNNSSISTSQENVTGTWDSNFKGVWHFNDNASSTTVKDSTSNANNGTAQVNTNTKSVSGKIGGGLSFNGVTDYVSVAGLMGSPASVTITGWINLTSEHQDGELISLGNHVILRVDNAASSTQGIFWDGTTWHITDTNKTYEGTGWHKLTYIYDNAAHTQTVYVDGVQIAQSNNTSPIVYTGLQSITTIGVNANTTSYQFTGTIDEPRISNVARTAGWDATEYNSQSNPSAFYSVEALQSQSSISTKDIDLIVDMDQSDRCGIVWREQDVSNFYELDIYDSLSNAGITNIVQLYKVVANVKTQIGSNVAIAFTRGTPHRFHVLMVGTAITVSMDGVNLISTTDSALAGPGNVGLIEVSGSAHFYNLRMQPQGQSLSGVNAYTRVTLTSTDPTVTPQLPDLVLAALHPNIGLGAFVPSVDYRRTLISANADDLAKKSDYYWLIDANKNVIFNPRVAIPAPWILTSNDVLFTSNLTVENSGDLYRNRQILTNVLTTLTVTETHPGDGSSTSWALQYPVVGNAPVITVNNQAKSIGIKGKDTGKDFYYALGSNSLAQDASGIILQPFVDSFTITYTGQSLTEVVCDNTGGLPGTTSQSQYAALTGGSGIVEVVEDVSSQQLTVAAATDYGNSLLQKYGVIGRTLTFQTNRTGLSVGQYLPVFIPEHLLNDAAMLITSMDLTFEVVTVGSSSSLLYVWNVTAVEGPSLGFWQKTLVQILGYRPSSRKY